MKPGKKNSTNETGRTLPVQWADTTKFTVPIPHDEPERLTDLESFAILDTMPEEVFDNIARLASQICQTPIAVISLVDSDRQWFKSKVGISMSETSRDIAFCAHAIMQHGLFVVPDASKDPRFAENPLVRAQPKLRFYAGAPLVSPDDHALGTLCVMDKVPRELTVGQKEALRVLSKTVMNQLELRRRLREVEKRLQRVDHETQFLKKSTKAARSTFRSCCKFMTKAAHELNTTAHGIVDVSNRALNDHCSAEQNELLGTARSGAESLVALARKMREMAEKAEREKS